MRTKVNYSELIKKDDEHDFTKEDTEMSSLERLINYKLTKATIDLDYCKRMRNIYDFCVMSDLYSVLWNIKMDDEVIDSAETLVSADLNISRCCNNIRRKQGKGINWEELKDKDEDLKCFAKSVAIIGNFMPVPAKFQALLLYMDERFDMVLSLIKAYYYDKDHSISTDFMHDSLKIWLKKYENGGGETSWKKFVDSNYLKDSFVDEGYNIVKYDNTLKQLSNMLYKRSVKMIEKYDEKYKETIKHI